MGEACSLSVGEHGGAPFFGNRQDAGSYCKLAPDTDQGMPVATKALSFSPSLT